MIPPAGFERWLAESVARFEPPLTFREVRQGVRALSALYVERRGPGLPARSADGAAKRAALATYYAPLHFLTTTLAVAGLAEGGLARVERVVDLGCGTGAAGAAAALACPAAPPVLGVDLSGWALGEARHTLAALGLSGRQLRRRLPSGLPRCGAGDLVVSGWFLNELAEPERRAMLEALHACRERGAALLVLEPLARSATPWWEAALGALGAGVADTILRQAIDRPERIAALDQASGLDHRELRARVAFARADAGESPPRPPRLWGGGP